MTETISGGHRHGTHSIVGLILATTVALFAARWTLDLGPVGPFGPVGVLWEGGSVQAGSAIIALLLIGLGLTTMKIMPGTLLAWVSAVGGAGAVALFAPENLTWLPVAVGIGYVAHLIGDSLTVGGVPWLWPWVPKPRVATPFWTQGGYWAVPVLGTTGSAREWLFEALLSMYVIGVFWLVF